MKYTINWLETKTPDWKIATLTNEEGMNYVDVSINRTNKKGEVFPNFDALLNGGTVEGEYWETPDKTKKYLFPPREVKASTGTRSFGGGVSKLMDKKAENIKEAQERKSESIAYFNSVNSALHLLEIMQPDMPGVDVKVFVKEWRDWFISEYEKWNSPTNKKPPF